LKLEKPELPTAEFMREVMSRNFKEGYRFFREVMDRLDCPAVFPADLVPVGERWGQSEFQALWLSIIAEKCTEIHMPEDWYLSNGATEEFTHVMQLRLGLPRDPDGKILFYSTKEGEETARKRMRSIKVYDHHGKEIHIGTGINRLDLSIEGLASKGFKAEKLERCRAALVWTRDMLDKGFYQ
jgi:hypothetical protein